MEVPATGIGATGPERALSNPIMPPAHLPPGFARNPPMAADSIASLLTELSQTDLTRLLQIVESTLPAADMGRAQDLLSAATEAVAAQDSGHAIELLRQLVHLDPVRADTLRSAPELASIRPALEQLLNQATASARLHAEGRFAEATQKLEMAAFKYNGEVRPEIFHLVAGKLLEAGGLANYVRSGAVSAALLDQSRWVPADVFQPLPLRLASAGWHISLRLVTGLWTSLGLAAIGICWWLRDDYLPIISVFWALGLLLLTALHYWQRRSRS